MNSHVYRILLCLLLTKSLGDFASAQSPETEKRPASKASAKLSPVEVEAGLLAAFPEYLRWPTTAFKDASSPLVIGILGQDPFRDILDTAVRGKFHEGRKIIIKRADHIDGLKGCQMIFIAKSLNAGIADLLRDLNRDAVVTVGEADDFLQKGGAIAFRMIGDKVRYEMNRAALKQAGIQVDSRLLPMHPIRVQ